MSRLNKDFFQAAQSLQNNAAFVRLCESIEEYRDERMEELAVAKTEDTQRLQGEVTALKFILDNFGQADEVVRRADDYRGTVPSVGTIN